MIALMLIRNIFLPKKSDGDHPNFILQLYSSMDFGRKWQLVHDNVMPGRFYWYDYAFFFFLSPRSLVQPLIAICIMKAMTTLGRVKKGSSDM